MRLLILSTTFLAFIVIIFGAFVRLSDAGLGCPDWPGCYGHLSVSAAQEAGQTLEAPKAWKEMIHRYAAGTLALMILAIFVFSLVQRRRHPSTPLLLPTLLMVMVLFQALLGMWTVTLKLNPLVVLGHLLGGFATLSLLWVLFIQWHNRGMTLTRTPSRLTTLALFLLILQIILGGWTSSNYAAFVCPDFPTCLGHWWPTMSLKEAFTFWQQIGPNYEGGVMGLEARVTIQMMHRLGALLVFVVFVVLGIQNLCLNEKRFKRIGFLITLLLLIQIALGIGNVLLARPLGIAVAHNGVAALLLLTTLTLIYSSNPKGVKL